MSWSSQYSGYSATSSSSSPYTSVSASPSSSHINGAAHHHHHNPPLPPQYPDVRKIALHPSLTYPVNSGPFFDVSQPPTYNDNQLATFPALPSLAIVCPDLPWPIVVFRNEQSGGVTVGDIHWAIYHFLRSPAPASRGSRSSPPRLAFLQGKVLFKGLTKSHIGSETWTMHCVSA